MAAFNPPTRSKKLTRPAKPQKWPARGFLPSAAIGRAAEGRNGRCGQPPGRVLAESYSAGLVARHQGKRLFGEIAPGVIQLGKVTGRGSNDLTPLRGALSR